MGTIDLRTRSAAPRVLLTIEQAAEAMALGRTLMYELVLRGEVSSIKVGRTRRVPLVALHDYVAREVGKARRGVRGAK